jgi:hypothetical protein
MDLSFIEWQQGSWQKNFTTLLRLSPGCNTESSSMRRRESMTDGSRCRPRSWPRSPAGIVSPGCLSDLLLLHHRPQQQRTKWCLLHLQRSCPSLPQMRQEPYGSRGESGRTGEHGRGQLCSLDPVSHLWPGKDRSIMTKLYRHGGS